MENSIGERIIGLRKKKGLTQSQLAEKLNISNKAVSKWESGKGDPSIEMLELLSELFDCSIDYLVKGYGNALKDNLNIPNDKKYIEEINYAEQVYSKALKIIKNKVSAITFDVWFSNIKPIRLEEGFVEGEYFMDVLVSSIQFKNVVAKKYEHILIDAIMKIDDSITQIHYKIEDSFTDPYFKDAVKLAIINNGINVSLIQRKLQIGYARAAEMIDGMESMNFISSSKGRKIRDVYIDKKRFEEMFNEPFDNKSN